MNNKITKTNFITDVKTNKVFISKLIDSEDGNLDSTVRSNLKNKILEFCSKKGQYDFLINTKDVWARDYMPIQLTKKVFLGYTYKPDYLNKYPKTVTNWQLQNVHPENEKNFGFKVVQIPLILDGGNVVKAIVNDKPCFIMCDKVLQENNVSEKSFRDWWIKWWKDNFKGTEMGLILLPWAEKYDPIGHADGMVRFVEDGKLLMTNLNEYEKSKTKGEKNEEGEKERYSEKVKRSLTSAGFKVESLHFLDKFKYKKNKMFRMLFEHTWSYINYLQVGKQILVPSLGYPKLDKEAKNQISAVFNDDFEIQIIDDVDMTEIVKEMNDITNSGGALNCLTWTIQTNGQKQEKS